jgi:hypothetical protein
MFEQLTALAPLVVTTGVVVACFVSFIIWAAMSLIREARTAEEPTGERLIQR